MGRLGQPPNLPWIGGTSCFDVGNGRQSRRFGRASVRKVHCHALCCQLLGAPKGAVCGCPPPPRFDSSSPSGDRAGSQEEGAKGAGKSFSVGSGRGTSLCARTFTPAYVSQNEKRDVATVLRCDVLGPTSSFSRDISWVGRSVRPALLMGVLWGPQRLSVQCEGCRHLFICLCFVAWAHALPQRPTRAEKPVPPAPPKKKLLATEPSLLSFSGLMWV